jgi:hypothetical protein
MTSFPAEVLFGIYLGLLVGIIPALVSWALGFSFKYLTGVSIPGFGVMILSVALAGVNGGLLALADESIMNSPNAPSIVTAIVIVSMLSLYAHSKGDTMAADFPQRLSFSALRNQTLSYDLADLVSGGDEVRIRVVGDVADMEGYPPLSEELRTDIRNVSLTFPADLRLDELEERMEERLQTEFDLGDVSVTIDERGRASVVAAPPFSGLSKRVTGDRHAISVEGLIPTGLARGDEVTVITPDAQARGIVISASSNGGGTDATGKSPDIEPLSNDEPAETDEVPKRIRAPTTEGGDGRLTVAVMRTDVQPLLRAGDVKIVVESRGTRREYEAVSMLRRSDQRFRRVAVRPGGPLDGRRLGHVAVDSETDVSILAVRKASGWLLAPRGSTTLSAGDELFAVGDRSQLDTFAGGVA